MSYYNSAWTSSLQNLHLFDDLFQFTQSLFFNHIYSIMTKFKIAVEGCVSGASLPGTLTRN